MYKIIRLALFGAVALLAVSCKPANQPRQFDGGAKLYVNVKDKLRSLDVETRALPIIDGDTQKILTPKEVVEEAVNFVLTGKDAYGNIVENVRVGITDSEMKDIPNARIKMREDMIVDRFGKLVTYFFEAKNVRIEGTNGIIIAYIPQATLQEAWTKIKAAYDKGDYDTVYKLFQDAYTAIPCTTKQYEALKAQGLN